MRSELWRLTPQLANASISSLTSADLFTSHIDKKPIFIKLPDADHQLGEYAISGISSFRRYR